MATCLALCMCVCLCNWMKRLPRRRHFWCTLPSCRLIARCCCCCCCRRQAIFGCLFCALHWNCINDGNGGDGGGGGSGWAPIISATGGHYDDDHHIIAVIRLVHHSRQPLPRCVPVCLSVGLSLCLCIARAQTEYLILPGQMANKQVPTAVATTLPTIEWCPLRPRRLLTSLPSAAAVFVFVLVSASLSFFS